MRDAGGENAYRTEGVLEDWAEAQAAVDDLPQT
jgi:hypothetical protein